MISLTTLSRCIYIDVFPRGSYGNSNIKHPATRNRVPEIKMGTDVVKSAYTKLVKSKRGILAIIGAMTPNIRLAVAAKPLPVPRSLVGNISGV